jgi:hypothetical protein
MAAVLTSALNRGPAPVGLGDETEVEAPLSDGDDSISPLYLVFTIPARLAPAVAPPPAVCAASADVAGPHVEFHPPRDLLPGPPHGKAVLDVGA